MILENIEIVDSQGNILVSYTKEQEKDVIVNNSCKLLIQDNKMLLMIKDYTSPNNSIKLKDYS